MKTIMVSSIKGGTGKSIIALNIAYLLRSHGTVGLLDADLDSSYFTEFTKIDKQSEVLYDRIIPVTWNDIKVFSLSTLVGRDKPASFYGADAVQVIRDAKTNVEWGKLDYLVIDMPPGAGDVFKEIIELYAETLIGGVIVSIPFAEIATVRLIKLYQLYEVPILGVVENMSFFKDPETGKIYHVFGESRIEDICREYNVKYYGKIPLDPRMPELIGKGTPFFPEDINEPIKNVVNDILSAREGRFYERFKKWLKTHVKATVDKILVSALVRLNKSLDIKAIKEKYGLPGGRYIGIIITDRLDNPVSSMVIKLKDDRVVLVKKEVNPDIIVKMDVPTLAGIVLGYRKVGGTKVPFDVNSAFTAGFLRIYGKGATSLILYLARTMFQDKELREKIVKELGSLLEKLM